MLRSEKLPGIHTVTVITDQVLEVSKAADALLRERPLNVDTDLRQVAAWRFCNWSV